MKLRIKILFVVLSVLLVGAHVRADGAKSDCRIAEAAIQEASRIRGLRIKSAVPCLMHTKEQVKEYLIGTISTKIPPEHLENEEIVYKALGFIPDQFHYKEGLIDLYLNQIGGYYDPDKKHYIMAAWLPDLMQATIAAHELTHALQDQYYNLDTFTDMKGLSSDELLARSALVEGDATAVMFDYNRKLSGLTPLRNETNINSILLQNVIGASAMSTFSNVPSSLQMLLIFPYTSGLRFAHTLLQRDGYRAIDKAFLNPPRSTEEILHPQKFLNRSPDFIKISDAALRGSDLPAGATRIYDDSYGEFSISALLSLYIVDKAKVASVAEGWGGDRVAIFREAGKRYVVWRTHWDTVPDADEFALAYEEALTKRYQGSQFNAGVTSEMLPDGRRYLLTQKGSDVSLVVEERPDPLPH